MQTYTSPTVMTLRDENGYNAALVRAGLSPDWVELGDYSITRDYSSAHGGRRFVFKFTGFPVKNTTMVVPNPKDIVTKGIGDIPSLRNDMADAAVSIMAGFWSGGSVDDPALAFSAPVFMLMQAVDGMAEAKRLGQQEEEAEAEAERKRKENLIILILSIAFLVSTLPLLSPRS